MNLPRLKQGFSLIELLIVISIIGSLAGMVLLNFTSQTRKARDVERQSDLRQYQTALETYANRSGGLYPVSSGVVDVDSLCTTLNLSGCPEDPRASVGYQDYKYRSDSGGTRFVLWAVLEVGNPQSAFVVCSNGKVDRHPVSTLNVPNNAQCPI